MSYQLPLTTLTSTEYTDAATLRGDDTVRLVVVISGGLVKYQVARPRDQWQQEQILPPGVATLERVCDGIRFRRYTAAGTNPVTVTVEAATRRDVEGH